MVLQTWCWCEKAGDLGSKIAAGVVTTYGLMQVYRKRKAQEGEGRGIWGVKTVANVYRNLSQSVMEPEGTKRNEGNRNQGSGKRGEETRYSRDTEGHMLGNTRINTNGNGSGCTKPKE